MPTVLVTGATGTLGRQIVTDLAARHFRARMLRHDDQTPTLPGVEAVVGDLATGAGLRDAVAGVDVIIHAATSFQHMQTVDVDGTQRLLQAAAAQASGAMTSRAAHVVYISIVGVDRTQFPYYVAKHTAETLVQQSGLPWSILRATPFHSYAEYIIQSLGADTQSAVTVPSGVRLQTIDSSEVADRLVAIAELGALGHVAEMGGPETLMLEAMTETYLRARGSASTVRAAEMRVDPTTDAMFDMFRSGVVLTPEHAVGITTWETYLRQKYSR